MATSGMAPPKAKDRTRCSATASPAGAQGRVFDRISQGLASGGSKSARIMIGSTHLMPHRTATSVFKIGALYATSDAIQGELNLTEMKRPAGVVSPAVFNCPRG